MSGIMFDVIAALLPALIFAVYIFGTRALVITLLSVISCVCFEYLYRRLMKKSRSIQDLSAVVTGLLLAFSLPVSVPLWLPVVGSFFAIVIVKQLFGGIGKNVVNPALAARIFLFAAFPNELVSFTKIGRHLPALKIAVEQEAADILVGATPLAMLKGGAAPNESLLDLLIGKTAGSIGEISAVLLLAGGLYLMLRRVIAPHIPLAYLGVCALVAFLFPHNLGGVEFCLYEILSGGLMIGAFFMATDYTTSPTTAAGRVIYGAACGLITMFIRYFGGYAEGVSFAVMFMNLFVWYLDKWTKPRAFGGVKNAKRA